MGAVRILHIGLSGYPGGVENAVMNYYRCIDREQVQFDFVCTEDSLAYSEQIDALGGRILYLPSPKRHMLRYRKALRRLINGGGYDAVHIHMLSAVNLFHAVFAHGTRVKRIIAHAHNASLPGRVKRIAHRVLKPLVPLFVTERMACSEAAAVWLFGRRGAKKTRILKNAIDHDAYRYDAAKRQAMRQRYGLASDETVIGHVGRFGEEKNQRFLVECLSRLEEHTPRARLLLVGDGPLLESVRQQARALGLEDRVIFVGGVDTAAPYYPMMDVFCLPSLHEGLGIAAIEAQISGLPCLCSTGVPAATAIMQATRRIPLAEPEAWVRALAELAGRERCGADPEELARVGYRAADEAVKLQDYYVKGAAYEATESAGHQP